ncbi:MAG: tetratricopeptide repeat protein [Deltaproteobacteria bacterium]|nr:tetratricopeptide repeat protein [Deltaproteobacteria bacterium]
MISRGCFFPPPAWRASAKGEMMVTIEREHLGLMMEAGYILVGMQRFKEAREVFEGLIAMAPESELPLVALASVDFCQGKFTEACRRYKKALQMNPTSMFAKAYLGEALFFMGKRTEAIAALKEATVGDTEGKAAAFAKALLDAVEQGFTPSMLAGVDDLKQYQARIAKEKDHVH